MDYVVAVKRSDGSEQIAKICPAYGRDDEGVVRVTWFSDGAEVGKFIPFNELYIVDLKINVPTKNWYSDFQKKLYNVALIIIVAFVTVYCLDVLAKWYRNNEVLNFCD